MVYESMRPDEMKACAALAARAFASYDFFSTYVPNAKRRAWFLRSMMKTDFRVNGGLAHFLTAKENGKIAAVAVLHDPGYRAPSGGEYLKAGFWKAMLIGGYKNVAAWCEMDAEAGKPCVEQAAGSWFLHLLAVDTGIEGKGIGSGMIKNCVIPCVREHGGRSLSLYTNSEINCRFYEKNGFRRFDSRTFSYNGKSFGSWSYLMDMDQ